MKKIFILILIFIFSINISSASLLFKQGIYSNVGIPVSISSCTNYVQGGFNFCVTSRNASNIQSVTIDSTWKTISGVKFYALRENSLNNNGNDESPTLRVRVYKSTTANFADASLWDTADFNINNVNLGSFTFNFDADMQIYSGETQILNSFWVEFYQPNYNNSNVDGQKNNAVAYYNAETTIYPGGKLYQSPTNTFTYSEMNQYAYPYNYGYADLTFELFGTFKIPQTPLPTPIIPGTTPSVQPQECSLADYYVGNCSTMPDALWIKNDSISFIPSFNNTTQYCPTCQGNETTTTKNTLVTTTAFCQTLIGFGYGSNTGCSSKDFISFLYDSSIGFFYLSIVLLMWKIYLVYKRK